MTGVNLSIIPENKVNNQQTINENFLLDLKKLWIKIIL